MTAEHQSIITAYEEEGMSIEEIAQSRDLDETAIKACLMQGSAKFRGDVKIDKKLDFNEDQLEWVTQSLVETAMSTEDDHLRAKICMYVRDDAKGRREPARGLNGNQFNILMLNERLQSIRGVADRIKEKILPSSQEIINA